MEDKKELEVVMKKLIQMSRNKSWGTYSILLKAGKPTDVRVETTYKVEELTNENKT